jgi:hypothetical protein
MGDRTVADRVLMERPYGKKPLGRHGREWKNNIAIYLQEVGWTELLWLRTGIIWRVFVNAVMNFRVQ